MANTNIDLLIQQYDTDNNFRQLVEQLNQMICDEITDPIDDIARQQSVLTATGIWLDRIGERFEVPRPFLFNGTFTCFGFQGNGVGFDQGPFCTNGQEGIPADDEFYRRIIIAKGGQLITDGTVDDMGAILSAGFGQGNYIDFDNMTMSVRIDADLREDEIQLILESALITKPAGVRLIELQIIHENGAFGFEGNGQGFDQAPFSRVVYLQV